MYDVAWKRALMTPMLCLTFYRINFAKNKKGKKSDGKKDRSSCPARSSRAADFVADLDSRCTRLPVASPRFVTADTDGDEVERPWPVLPFCMYGSFRNGAGAVVA